MIVVVYVQVLVVQAFRPDRLQSAMSLFASKALGESVPDIYDLPSPLLSILTDQWIPFVVCFIKTPNDSCLVFTELQ